MTGIFLISAATTVNTNTTNEIMVTKDQTLVFIMTTIFVGISLSDEKVVILRSYRGFMRNDRVIPDPF